VGVGGPARGLVFCPDAVGDHLADSAGTAMALVRRSAPLELALRACVPPVTPVCFASMFTGAPPGIHGIVRYEKPVLSCDTVFDCAVRAGLGAGIVAVRGSSIDLIFRGRPIDYFSMPDDRAVRRRAIELIEAREHELLVVYQQDYDDLLHERGPFDAAALEAVRRHSEDFAALVGAAEAHWAGPPWFASFAPDHGAHVLPGGRGDHGEDIPEDMAVTHFWRLSPPGSSGGRFAPTGS